MGNFLNKVKSAYYEVVNAFKDKDTKSNDGQYRLILDDTFTEVGFDGGHWSKVAKGKAAWCEHACDDADLFEFTKDGLRMHVSKTEDSYRTCGITTMGKVGFSKGKIEVTAKMKNCPHSWHAIWLYGEKNAELGEESEVDMSECFYDKGFTYQTIHNKHIHDSGKSGDTGRGFLNPEEWNTFTCEIDDYSVRLYINGVKTKEYFNSKDGNYGFADVNNPLKVILSAQLGGGWPGYPKDNDILSGWIEISRVKIWTL